MQINLNKICYHATDFFFNVNSLKIMLLNFKLVLKT